MHLYSDLLNFISTYGYWGVFFGALLEGETLILISGFLVHEGYLLLRYVLVFGFIGAVLGDGIWFLLGKYWGDKILSAWPWFKEVTHKPIGYMTKKPALVSFWVRFIYGFRHVIPFSLGMTRYPFHKFLFWNSLGALFWVFIFAGGGYIFGNILETFLGRLKHYQLVTVIIVILIIVLFNYIAKLFKRSVETVMKE
jgi:membrane protein DedA with SNARE-associated domain